MLRDGLFLDEGESLVQVLLPCDRVAVTRVRVNDGETRLVGLDRSRGDNGISYVVYRDDICHVLRLSIHEF